MSLDARMSLFAGSSFGTNTVFGNSTTPGNSNPMKDFEVTSPPDDSISSMKFSPAVLPSNFLVAGSWDNNVRYMAKDLRLSGVHFT